MTITLAKIAVVSVSDVEIYGIDFQDVLSSTETLNTPAVTEVGSSALTIAGVSVNTTSTIIDGRIAATGKAVVCTISGQVASGAYRCNVSVLTSNSPRALNRDFLFNSG